MRVPAVAALIMCAGLLAPHGVSQAASGAPEDVVYAQYLARQDRLVTSVDRFWVDALRAAGVAYSSPIVRVAARGDRLESECGRDVADPIEAGPTEAGPTEAGKAYPAFYCRDDRSINLSSGWLYRVIHSNFSDGGVAAVIAHEFGHHVQRSVGIADPSTRRQELQADCLAGTWMRVAADAGKVGKTEVAEARRTLKALGDTRFTHHRHHGSPAERVSWFKRGYRNADASACNH